MGNLFSDDAVRELRRMYHEWRQEDKNPPRNNRPSPRPVYPREDLVLYQASSTGTLPAVTASTTGVTPGKITTAKQLTITSTGGAVAASTARSLTIYNVGSGSGAASHVGFAHREFKTGRWVTAVPQAGETYVPPISRITGASTPLLSSTTGSLLRLDMTLTSSGGQVSVTTSDNTVLRVSSTGTWVVLQTVTLVYNATAAGRKSDAYFVWSNNGASVSFQPATQYCLHESFGTQDERRTTSQVGYMLCTSASFGNTASPRLQYASLSNNYNQMTVGVEELTLQFWRVL